MTHWRAFILRHRWLAIVLVFAALSVKLVVPNGFMIGVNAKILTVQLCDESFGAHAFAKIVVPLKENGGDTGTRQGKAVCPFASVAMSAAPGLDAALSALAIAFILARGFAPAPALRRPRKTRLRPPLRGPPAFA